MTLRFKTLVEITVTVVGELEVEPEEGTELLQSHDKTEQMRVASYDEQRK